MSQLVAVKPDSPAAFIDRELSWLSFARRVLALAEDPEQPLLERVKFAGIMGMIYDEFAMKRIGGLFHRVRRGEGRRGPAGLTPAEVLEACRAELRSQQALVAGLVEEQLRPALRDLGTPILDAGDLDPSQREFLARYFADSVEPILTPSPRTPHIRSRSSATSASTWRYWSPSRAAAATVSCGSRCHQTGRDGCRCRATRAGCPLSR
jgi:polyphosphate kinase